MIGGGVTGCSCALTLAERGVRVRLHEAREIAGGASGRNGGFALRGATPPYDEARRLLGAEHARLVLELTERSLDRLEELAGDAFRRVGSLRLALDDAERDALRSEHDALREDGFAVEWVDTLAPPLDRPLPRRDPPPDRRSAPAGALGHGAWQHTRPRRAPTCARATRCSSTSSTPTWSSWPETGSPRVSCPSSPAWSARRVGRCSPPSRCANASTSGRTTPAAASTTGSSCPMDGSCSAAAGMRHRRPRRPRSRRRRSWCRAGSTTLVEELVGYPPRITHRWAGIWGTTPDLEPLVGPVPGRDGVWVAGGYSGHGNVLGLACGDLVARAILGEQPPELAIFDPARFALG